MPPIQPPDDDPLQDTFAEAREERVRHDAFLATLRENDPAFAEASSLLPDDMSEWQGTVYLLTGNHEIWAALGSPVLEGRSLGPVISELDDPRRPWSSSEHCATEPERGFAASPSLGRSASTLSASRFAMYAQGSLSSSRRPATSSKWSGIRRPPARRSSAHSDH